MAKTDFEKVKGQLKELSELINSFKSEAVQLKLIDMIFQDSNPVEIKAASQPKAAIAKEDKPVTEVKIGKKRGRKPGIKLAPKTENVEVAPAEPSAPKKRGRKPKAVSLDAPVKEKVAKVKPAKVAKTPKAPKTAKIAKAVKVAKTKLKAKTKKSKNERPGPSKMLEQLVDEGFFAQPHPIGDVVSYCKEQHNLEYKTTDISGILMRMVKKGRLSRHTNEEKNQFEYFNFVG